MTKIVCPHCNRAGSSSKQVPHGAKVKCPACGGSFRFTDPDRSEYALVPDQVIPAAAMATPAPAARAPSVRATWEAAQPPSVAATSPTALAFQQVIHVAAPERQRTNPVGIAALVLGILTALIAWIPFLGLLAIPSGLLGALLGAIGLVYGLVTSRGKVAASGVGLGLSLGSIVLAVAMTGSAAKGISDAMDKANQSARPAKIDKKQAQAGPATPKQGLAPAAPPVGPQVGRPEEVWLTPDQAGRLGNIQVRIVSATLGPVRLRNKFRLGQKQGATDESKDRLLSIVLEVTNLDPNLKLDYKSLAGDRISFERDYAEIKDNFGNHYRRINFGFGSDPEYRTEQESVYPQRSIRDQLVFESPVGNSTHLDLEIPGKNVGQTGFYRFRIPTQNVAVQ